MSGSGYIGKTTNRSATLAQMHTQSERESLWGEIDGEIKRFYPEKQTADIQPLHRPIHNGQEITMPMLLDVPVNFPRAGHGAITSPIVPGDRVRMRSKMRSSEKYHSDDDASMEDWTRSYHLADMEAFIDGGNSASDPIKNFDSENTHLRFDEEGRYGIRGSKDGKYMIEGCEGNIYDLVATALELIADDGLDVKTGSSAGKGIHALENRSELQKIAAKLRAMAL